MYSIRPGSVQLLQIDAAELRLPLFSSRVSAGFPSPAEDFIEKRLDLNSLITHPMATIFMRASGTSMINAGIDDGDLLVINRALPHLHWRIVVAEVDGQFTVKRLIRKGGKVKLMPDNPTFPEITFKDGQELRITGVVHYVIKSML